MSSTRSQLGGEDGRPSTKVERTRPGRARPEKACCARGWPDRRRRRDARAAGSKTTTSAASPGARRPRRPQDAAAGPAVSARCACRAGRAHRPSSTSKQHQPQRRLEADVPGRGDRSNSRSFSTGDCVAVAAGDGLHRASSHGRSQSRDIGGRAQGRAHPQVGVVGHGDVGVGQVQVGGGGRRSSPAGPPPWTGASASTARAPAGDRPEVQVGARQLQPGARSRRVVASTSARAGMPGRPSRVATGPSCITPWPDSAGLRGCSKTGRPAARAYSSARRSRPASRHCVGVAEGHGAGVPQVVHLGQALALAPWVSAAMGARRTRRVFAPHDHLRHGAGVVDRRGLRADDDRGEAAANGRAATAAQVLFVFFAGVAEVSRAGRRSPAPPRSPWRRGSDVPGAGSTGPVDAPRCAPRGCTRVPGPSSPWPGR